MKKGILLLLSLFFFSITSAFAATDWRVGTLTCNYKQNSNEISVTYYNVGAALGDAEVYYKAEYKKGNEKYCYTSGWIDKCDSGSKPWNTMGIYNFNSNFRYGEKDFYSIKNRLTRSSYRDGNNFNTDTLCSKAVFISDLDNDSMDDLILCETNNTNPECNYNGTTLFTLEGKTIGVNSSAGSNKADYTSSYKEAKTQQEKYCNKNSKEYNAELCAKATADVNATVYEAEKSGTTQAELEKEYMAFKSNIELNFDTQAGCESYLGNPKDNVNKPPAYYLQFAFNLLKYAAIIMLLILTIVEFAKATASSNQDAMKKAISNTIKRIIIAIVIFLLPMLIEFLFRVLGIYSSTTCGIK